MDDTGKMQMKVKVCTCDRYDMVDISVLKVGDTIVTHAGEATIRVSADFKGYDNSDPEQGEVIIYPGDFLIGGVADYNFTPYNTTIRVEGGQIVEMNRVYTP